MKPDFHKTVILCSLSLSLIFSCQTANPKTAADFLEAANIHFERKNYQAVIENCTKAIELDPANPEAWNSRAYAYFLLEDYEKAIASYTETLRLEPEMGVAWVYRSQAYTQIGEHEKADDDIETIKNLIEAQKAASPIINHNVQ